MSMARSKLSSNAGKFNMLRRDSGFTLIELLVTIVVLGIALSVAIPSFNDLIRNNKSLTLGGDFVSALNFARTEAIKRATRVSICPSTDKTSCATEDDWAKGWIVFIDSATSDSATAPVIASSAGTILRYWSVSEPKAQLGFAAAGTIPAAKVKSGQTLVITATTPVNFVRFTSLGTLAKVSGNSNITFKAHVTGCTAFNTNIVSIGIAGLISTDYISC